MTLRRYYSEALIREVKGMNLEASMETIYVGGGTPSVLESEDLKRLLNQLQTCLKTGGEFTVECNPDDITEALASMLRNCGVNRVSLGVQTFSDERLKTIGRRHDAQQAINAVKMLREAGIANISIDLMFGFPAETLDDWKHDIRQALSISPEHISAYCLSVEHGTVLERRLKSAELPALPSDEQTEEMYFTLCHTLKAAGYKHYEISNFCRPDRHSRHNSGYWQDKPYIGLGAGAYGMQPGMRYCRWHDIRKYIDCVNSGRSTIQETETIDAATHFNDLITTAMRTSQGLSFIYIKENFPPAIHKHFLATARQCEQQGLVKISPDGRVTLHPQKLFVSDPILSRFIY